MNHVRIVDNRGQYRLSTLEEGLTLIQHIKKFVIMVCMATLATSFATPVWAADPPVPPVTNAKAVALLDATTGQELYARHASLALPMASVTKLMTLYIAIEAINHHKIRLDELVPADEAAYHIAGSQIWLRPGERLSVDQMLRAIAIGSANDAAYALGTFLSGSEPQFVSVMNHTAQQLGMTHTHFVNPHGLPALDHYTTAHDLAVLGKAAVHLPLLLHYTKQWQDRTIRNGKGGKLWLINQNRLLRTYAGADGLKTGYTQQAGFCMVATAQRMGTRLVAVVLGAPTSRDRFQDAATLLTWGFQHFRTVQVIPAGAIPRSILVIQGIPSQVPLKTRGSRYFTLPITDQKKFSFQVHLPTRMMAPVHRGQVVGYIAVTRGSTEVSRVQLVASREVRKLSLGELTWEYFWKVIG